MVLPDIFSLESNSNLSKCWLAAFFSRTKFMRLMPIDEIFHLDLTELCDDIEENRFGSQDEIDNTRFNVYLKSQLLLGIVKILQIKVNFLLREVHLLRKKFLFQLKLPESVANYSNFDVEIFDINSLPVLSTPKFRIPKEDKNLMEEIDYPDIPKLDDNLFGDEEDGGMAAFFFEEYVRGELLEGLSPFDILKTPTKRATLDQEDPSKISAKRRRKTRGSLFPKEDVQPHPEEMDLLNQEEGNERPVLQPALPDQMETDQPMEQQELMQVEQPVEQTDQQEQATNLSEQHEQDNSLQLESIASDLSKMIIAESKKKRKRNQRFLDEHLEINSIQMKKNMRNNKICTVSTIETIPNLIIQRQTAKIVFYSYTTGWRKTKVFHYSDPLINNFKMMIANADLEIIRKRPQVANDIELNDPVETAPPAEAPQAEPEPQSPPTHRIDLPADHPAMGNDSPPGGKQVEEPPQASLNTVPATIDANDLSVIRADSDDIVKTFKTPRRKNRSSEEKSLSQKSSSRSSDQIVDVMQIPPERTDSTSSELTIDDIYDAILLNFNNGEDIIRYDEIFQPENTTKEQAIIYFSYCLILASQTKIILEDPQGFIFIKKP